MSNSLERGIEQHLQGWMQKAGLSSFRALARESGVSRRQVDRLRRGEVQALSVQTAERLAQALQIPVMTLIQPLEQGASGLSLDEETLQSRQQYTALMAECQRLRGELVQLKASLQESFQAEVLNTLESFLLYWPVAALKAQQDPAFPASRLIPLLKPVEALLAAWEVEAIAPIGAVLPYDPTLQQWIEVDPAPAVGDPVQVSHGGYRHRGRLLHRAKVRRNS